MNIMQAISVVFLSVMVSMTFVWIENAPLRAQRLEREERMRMVDAEYQKSHRALCDQFFKWESSHPNPQLRENWKNICQ